MNSTNSKHTIRFKKVIAILTATMLTVPYLVGCTSNTSASNSSPVEVAPTIQLSWLPEVWDQEADVVVVGYGAAGAMAAKAAYEDGSSVIIIEKESELTAGGASIANGGTVSPNDADGILTSSRGRLLPETAQIIAEESQNSIDWLISEGKAEMNGILVTGYGVGFYNAIKRGISPLGIEVIYETPAQKLIFDPVTHEVFGVQCMNKSENIVNVKANKGVILATGGYLNNPELVSSLLIPQEVGMVNLGAPSLTGDGLIMAMEIGAAATNLTWQSIEWDGFAFKKASEDMGTGIGHRLTRGCIDTRIIVNANGERFMNENRNLIHYKGNIPHLQYDGDYTGYPGWANLPMYVIFDSQLADSGAIGPNSRSSGWASNMKIYDNWSIDNQTEVEKGWLIKADTIEELVEKLSQSSGNEKIDPVTLQNTIDTYNKYCINKVDEDFGRGQDSLIPLKQGPYYAAELVPSALYTIGGLLGGQNGETLDWHGNAIPRLYHAGDIGQPAEVSIVGLSGCMGLGTIAGRAVSALPPIGDPTDANREIPQYTNPISMKTLSPAKIEVTPAPVVPEPKVETEIKLDENEYLGIGEGGMGGPITIKVTMKDDKISAIEVIEEHETVGIATPAIEQLPGKMIEAQSAEVDSISGATMTSTALKNALKDALSKIK